MTTDLALRLDLLWHELAAAETEHDQPHAAHCWADIQALLPAQREPDGPDCE